MRALTVRHGASARPNQTRSKIGVEPKGPPLPRPTPQRARRQTATMVSQRVLALVLLCTHAAHGFYLPGVAVREYQADERVDIKVNKLTSTKTQLPYDYYTLPFCKPEAITNAVENLGEVLHGSVIQNSPYDIFMGKSDFKVACRVELTKNTAALLAKRIKEDYRVHLIMDNLPAATKMIREMPDGKTITMYDRGYPLGFVRATPPDRRARTQNARVAGEAFAHARCCCWHAALAGAARLRVASGRPAPWTRGVATPGFLRGLPAGAVPMPTHAAPCATLLSPFDPVRLSLRTGGIGRAPGLNAGHSLPVQPPAFRDQVPPRGLLHRLAHRGLRGCAGARDTFAADATRAAPAAARSPTRSALPPPSSFRRGSPLPVALGTARWLILPVPPRPSPLVLTPPPSSHSRAALREAPVQGRLHERH